MKNKRIYGIFLILFLVVIAVSAGYLVVNSKSRSEANDNLEEIVKESNIEASANTEIEDSNDPYKALGITVPEKNLNWKKLHKENEDIYAWITVSDTTVDYPVLQHPTDNVYYLNHNIDGSKGFPGCLYTEDYNTKTFDDPNTVIYGHNLKDKTMFSSLHNYEDEATFKKDQFIYVYTEDDVFVYRVFAAYEFNANHLLLNYDYSNEYAYEQYIKDIKNVGTRGYGIANIKEDVEVTKEDKIITLSTCTSDHNDSQRYLVVGVLVNPEVSEEK